MLYLIWVARRTISICLRCYRWLWVHINSHLEKKCLMNSLLDCLRKLAGVSWFSTFLIFSNGPKDTISSHGFIGINTDTKKMQEHVNMANNLALAQKRKATLQWRKGNNFTYKGLSPLTNLSPSMLMKGNHLSRQNQPSSTDTRESPRPTKLSSTLPTKENHLCW